MSRLSIQNASAADKAQNRLYGDLARRNAVAPAGNCPVEQTASFVRMSLSQSCGKCTPCRIGLAQLADLLEQVLDGEATAETLRVIGTTAKSIMDSADCAIGVEAARTVYENLKAFEKDFKAHVETGNCTASFEAVPCRTACPAHVDVPGYIALTKDGRYADAIRVIRQDNPFPSVCALICEHPCEHKCRRNMVDDAINIRGIKRAAVDRAGDVPAPECGEANGKTVAVIGGGPSGLTAAYYLQLMGYQVTVYEKREKFGGMLRYGIPRYRLPDQYLDGDISVILSTGVKAYTNVDVTTEMYEKLKKENDAVYLAIGAHSFKKIGVDGEDADGVMSAVELLRAMGDGNRPDFAGKDVVIVGGGNVAMDCTRTAKRLGAKSVKCVYRRRQIDMTALPEEVEGAIAEGCEMVTMMAPARIESDANGKVTALVVKPQLPGAYDGGRPKPVNSAKDEVHIACDIVIGAIGQSIDSKAFEAAGVETKRGTIVSDSNCKIASDSVIFAGGDCASGPSTVIRAVEAGKTAAANIDEALGMNSELPAPVEIPAASHNIRGSWGRINMLERAPEERANDFELMEYGVSDEETAQECSRCLRCDHYGYGAFCGGRIKKW